MTPEERKAKVADFKTRAKDLEKRMRQHAVDKQFHRQLVKSDPKAAAAKSKFRVLKRQGKTPEEIKESMTSAEKAAFVRSLDAAKAFSRKALDQKK